jgi:hypothetical protein
MNTLTNASRREDLRVCRRELARSRKRLVLYRQLHLPRPANAETQLQERLAETIAELNSACPSA